VPYLTGGFASGLTNTGGQQALVEQSIIQRQTFRGVNGVTAYPFSETRRLEFNAGFQQVTFTQEVRTIVTSIRTGQQLSDDTQTTSLADALHLGTASAAAVFDSSVFGATSPIAGQRSRFEISPTTGTLSFTGALADYRRYFMPARFYTIAGRVMHYGRYGPGGEDPRLLPLFIGYPELGRGYGIGSFRANECTTTGAAGTCEAFDRLQGSRMLIGNVEFRFPLLRPFGTSQGMYGPVPVEVAFFADGGVAWNKGDRPSLFGGEREPVSSGGVTLRMNMFGFAIAQIDLAYPFQRPGRGWVWGFSLTPGF
jgi:outer membrane protein assembly factor BamA